MMKTKVRRKDATICDETPITREVEATKLQSRGKYLGQGTEETEVICNDTMKLRSILHTIIIPHG